MPGDDKINTFYTLLRCHGIQFLEICGFTVIMPDSIILILFYSASFYFLVNIPIFCLKIG